MLRPYNSQGHKQALYVKVHGMHSSGCPGIPVDGLLYAPTPLNSSREPVGFDALAQEQIVPSVCELRRQHAVASLALSA